MSDCASDVALSDTSFGGFDGERGSVCSSSPGSYGHATAGAQSSLKTYGTSIGTRSGIALPSISAGGANSSLLLGGKPRSYRTLVERHDSLKDAPAIWEELKGNVTRYIFPNDAQTVVPFAMAKLVTYAKYGPAVEDPKDGVLRLRGSQKLLMHHEEALLVKEEIRSAIVDIYMLKGAKAQGGKRAKAVGSGGESTLAGLSSSANRSKSAAANAVCSSSSLDTSNASSSSAAMNGSSRRVSIKALAMGTASKATVPENNKTNTTANASASAPPTVEGGENKKPTSQLVPLKKLINTIVPTSKGATSDNLPPPPPPPPPLRKQFAAANIKATAVPEEVYGHEMLDAQHPMASQVLEMTREELRQILSVCEKRLPLCEKDGSKLKRSTIVDTLADTILSERDRRVFALKRSDTLLEDVRTDPLLSKRKELTIYNKTAPKAYSITCYDQPHHVQRALHRRAFQVVDISEGNNAQVAQNVRCLRDDFRIEPGTVKEGWDGYCCLRGKKYGGGPVFKHTPPTE